MKYLLAISGVDIAWWENLGSGVFDDYSTIDNNFAGPRSVYATDVDSDGDIDVLGAAEYEDEIAWWENTGSESFGNKNVIILPN